MEVKPAGPTATEPQDGRSRKKLGAAGLLLMIAVASGFLTYFHWCYPRLSTGPEQPIAFSHRLHVADKQIDCYYCHPYAARSINAGIPSVQKCLGCHAYIIPRHPEIQKLKGYADRQEQLPWVRIFYNPDHVYFPHFRHIDKKVACSECHRQVESQDRLMAHTFTMGFCLGCHDQRRASRECVGCHQ